MKIKRQFTGEVTSNKMEKTVKVTVTRSTRHPKYKKIQVRKRHFMAHTDMPLNIGDTVTVQESRPYSKNVRWVVISK